MDYGYWQLESDVASFGTDTDLDKVLATDCVSVTQKNLQYRPAVTDSCSAGTNI